MSTPRDEKKLVALNKANCEEHPRSNVAQNSSVSRSQEDITQISEKIEGRVRKKFSQEFSRTENRILGALARLDDFLMNLLIQGRSGTAPETSRNALSTSQGTNEDDSQSDPHPEAGIFHNQTTRSSGPEEGHDSAILWSDYDQPGQETRVSKNKRKQQLVTEDYITKTRHDFLRFLLK